MNQFCPLSIETNPTCILVMWLLCQVHREVSARHTYVSGGAAEESSHKERGLLVDTETESPFLILSAAKRKFYTQRRPGKDKK